MRESNTTFSLSHTYKYLKTGQPSYLRSLFYSLHIVVLGLPLLSHLVALLSPLVLKHQTDLSIILLLFYRTIFHLIYVRLFITSLLLLFQTRLCLIFQPLFSLRSWKPISFTLPFLLSPYSPITYYRTDISGIDQALSFHLTHIPLSFTVISFTQFLCYLTCKCLWIRGH